MARALEVGRDPAVAAARRSRGRGRSPLPRAACREAPLGSARARAREVSCNVACYSITC